jgi:DHA3 family tetracycline resistance protein-like MFS transporter
MQLRSRASAPAVYLATRAIAGFAFGLIVIVYALLYIQVAGLDPLQLVLVGTALEASYFIFEVPTGAFADTYSRRFSVIAGFAICGLAWIGEAIVPTFLAIVVCEAVRGIGEALLSGAQDAWIAGEVGDDAIGPLFMRGHQLNEAAWIMSVPAGVALGMLDVRIPVIVGGALFAVLAAYLLLAMPERGFVRTHSEARPWTRLAETARDGSRVIRRSPLLLSIVAIAFFTGAASEGTDRLREAHFLTDLGLPGELPAVVWFGIISVAASLLSIAALQVLRPWLLRVVADDRAMGKVLAGYTAAQLALQLAFAWAPGFALGVAARLGQALLASGSVERAWTVRQIEPEVRATVLSMRGMLSGVGQVAGGPPVGAIGSLLGIRMALTASALLLLPTVALYRRASMLARPTPVREPQDTAR